MERDVARRQAMLMTAIVDYLGGGGGDSVARLKRYGTYTRGNSSW